MMKARLVQTAVNIIKLCQYGKLKPETTVFDINIIPSSTLNGVSFSRVRAQLMCSVYSPVTYTLCKAQGKHS